MKIFIEFLKKLYSFFCPFFKIFLKLFFCADSFFFQKKLILFFLVFLFFQPAFALLSDNQQVLIANADQAEIDQNTHKSFYKGHVIVNQGTRHLTADHMTIELTPENQLNQITAFGSPAHFSMMVKEKDPPLLAQASIMEYYPEKNEIILKENAVVTHQKDKYQAKIIYYDLKTATIKSPAQAGQRIMITLPSDSKQH